jgi:hypothetical protein
MQASTHPNQTAGFKLSFRPLAPGQRACAVPCDDQGRVDLDALGEQVRNDYLFARALVGRDFDRPCVTFDA